jgi:hypothetical protein
MAVRDDLVRIAKLANKGVTIIDSAAQTTILVDPSRDTEGETQVNLTPGQRQAIQDRLAPVTAEIKTKAVGLP